MFDNWYLAWYAVLQTFDFPISCLYDVDRIIFLVHKCTVEFVLKAWKGNKNGYAIVECDWVGMIFTFECNGLRHFKLRSDMGDFATQKNKLLPLIFFFRYCFDENIFVIYVFILIRIVCREEFYFEICRPLNRKLSFCHGNRTTRHIYVVKIVHFLLIWPLSEFLGDGGRICWFEQFFVWDWTDWRWERVTLPSCTLGWTDVLRVRARSFPV